MNRRQMKFYFAALTLILLSLWAVLYWALPSPSPPTRNADTRHREVVEAIVKPSRGSTQIFVVTAYTHTGNPTATGTMPHRGTIAADPDILPYNTRLFIPGYGFGTVTDCGGLIKGNRLDVFMESEQEAKEWGCRTVEVRFEKE